MNRPLRLTILIFGLLSSACTVQTSDMDRLMRQEGITEATYSGYSLFGCSKDDSINTEFSGTKNGQPVSGVVCGGFAEAYTVRYR